LWETEPLLGTIKNIKICLAEGTKAQMEEYQTGAVNATTSADI
jgi:hypothetical protein